MQLGWDPIREALDQELPCLAIAWSREEPDRAGEVTLLDDQRVLGPAHGHGKHFGVSCVCPGGAICDVACKERQTVRVTYRV